MPGTRSECERSACAFPLVAVTGGDSPALRSFARSLRPDGVAYLVLGPQSPSAQSAFAQMLSERCLLPVQHAIRRERLQPNVVYVVPEKSGITLSAGELQVVDEPAEPCPRTQLFSALARMQGPACAGVVLSDFDLDASNGLSAVRSAGGAFFLYDEGKHSEQPLQLADGTWCACTNPARIRDALRAWKNSSFDGRSLDPMLRSRLVDRIDSTFGIDLSSYGAISLHTQVLARMGELTLDHAADYVALFDQSKQERSLLLERLVLGSTLFFRDAWVFEALRERVFPSILDEEGDRMLRLWIPGCSTGEEVYSIAITLLELLAQRGDQRRVRIFATDVREDAIAHAREGIYPLSIRESVTAQQLETFFTPYADRYRVRPRLRDVLFFKRHDLLHDPPYASVDFVSCRNLLLYLDRGAQRRALERMSYALVPGGTLLLGSSESPRAAPHLFRLLDARSRLYVKGASVGRNESHWLHGGAT